MQETTETLNWFDAVGDVLTRITLDMRAAIVHSDGQEARVRAFALVHLVRTTTETLAGGVWDGVEQAGEKAARQIVAHCRANPQDYPEWLKHIASGWAQRLP